MLVGEIAALALDAVAGEITDAVHPASLSEDTQGDYDVVTGSHAITTVTAVGRAVVQSEKAIADIFPEYVAGPSDEAIMLEGFTACRENMRLTFGGWVRTITAVQDVLNAGSLFTVVARKHALGPNELPSLGGNPEQLPDAAPNIFVQSSALLVWTVNHNLGWTPQVTILSVGGNELEAAIHHPNANQFTVTFNTAQAGSAVYE